MKMRKKKPPPDPEKRLVKKIRASRDNNNIVATTLKTDERVIARVTDGIYRQPGSALRELISNAYDADATRVVIKTDAPRFARISVEDDGHGMSPEALAYLLLHIGGSAKRSDVGSDLGVTSAKDAMKSPNGRRLIGKIGIGLFSVSQLTHAFQIITKVKGDNYRTVATVTLRQYTDEDLKREKGPDKRLTRN
jgi:HSP90 family molecular chaperone